MSVNIKKIVLNKLKSLTNKKFDENSNVYEIGIDSLDLVELITDAEEEFKIQITDEELENIKIVGDIIKIIDQKISPKT